MEMYQIRYMLAASRTLNFTRAAAECNVSQPALTKAIKALEERIRGVESSLLHRYDRMDQRGDRLEQHLNLRSL